MRKLNQVLAQHWLQFIAVLLFSVALNAVFAAADPLITKTLIDEGLLKRNFRAFVLLAVAVVLFGVLVRIGFWFSELLAQSLKNKLTESLTKRMLRTYYRIGYAETLKADSGYFLSRIYDEPAKIAQGSVATWIGVVVQVVTFLTAAAVALYLSWRITLLLSMVVPLLYHLGNRFGPRITRVSKRENEEEARLREVLTAAVGAYRTVRIFALQEPVHVRVGEKLREFLAVLYSRVKTSKSYQLFSTICLSLAEAMVLVAAGYEVVAGNLSIGGLFGFMTAFWKLLGAANGIVAQVPELAKLSGYIERLTEFQRLESLRAEEDCTQIELEQVTVGYSGQDVIKDLSLQIGRDEKVLIVGPNGSGKSTLAHVMTRLLEPNRGKVRAPRLERVSALLTPFYFIPGTLKDNVAYEGLGEEEKLFFWRLVDEFDLREKVDQDPSAEFSEGQKKKAQIIMTLLKEADIYIFDEPFAHVDSESKEKILRQQLRRSEGKTLIAIMHGEEKFYPLFGRVVSLTGLPAIATEARMSLEEECSHG